MASSSRPPPPPQKPLPPSPPPLSRKSEQLIKTEANKVLNLNDTTALITCLSNLSHSTLQIQSQAKEILNYLEITYPHTFCGVLICFLHNRHPDTDIKVCNAASEILPRVLSRTSYPEFLKPILHACAYKGDSIINVPHFCECLSKMSIEELPIDYWNDVLSPVMLIFLESGNESKQEIGIALLNKFVQSGVCKNLDAFLGALCENLKQILQSKEASFKVKSETVKTSFACIIHLFTDKNDDILQDLLRKVLNTVYYKDEIVITKSEEKYVQFILEALIALAEKNPRFLELQIHKIIEFIIRLGDKPEFEIKMRFLGLQFVACMVEGAPRSVGRSILPYTRSILSQILAMLGSIDDDPEWDADEKRPPDASAYAFAYGASSLNRLARAFDGRFLLEEYPTPFESYLSSDKWQSRNAAVSSFAIITKVSPRALKHKLDLVIQPVMKVVEDIHPRVRWTAIYAIKQFSKSLSPEFQNQCHQQVLPALVKAMKDFQNPCIQVEAAKAMFRYGQNCNLNSWAPYLGEIVSKLLKCLQRGKQKLRKKALRALASIASSSQDQFQEYYRTVMSYLKVIVIKASKESNQKLLAASLECITMVWVAVGKEKVTDDIQLVVQLLISLGGSKLETDDPMRIEVLQAWGRLCKCLGQEFQAYMDIAIPRLLQSAQLDSYLSLPKHSAIEGSDKRNQTTDVYGKVLKEKATACNVLCSCAAELKEGFDLWIDEVAQTLVPLLTFDLHDEVKIAAVTATPVILKASKAAEEKGHFHWSRESPFKKLGSYLIPALVEALHKETMIKIHARMLDSLDTCMKTSGHILNTDQTRHFLGVTIQVLMDSSSISGSKAEAEQGEKVHDKASDCLTKFIRTHECSLSQFFDQLLPCMAHIWDRNSTAKQRKAALRIFSDVAEQCQEEAFKYCEHSLPNLFQACNDENPEMQEVAARGIGISAQFGGSIFKPLAKDALHGLNAVIRNPMPLHRNYVLAHDAAISALGKICLFHHDRINGTETFNIWLTNLPIKNDLDEAKAVHDLLCMVVEELDQKLLDVYVPKIIAVFAEVLWADDHLATEETVNRMIIQLKRLKNELPSETWASVLSSLEPFQYNIVQPSLSS